MRRVTHRTALVLGSLCFQTIEIYGAPSCAEFLPSRHSRFSQATIERWLSGLIRQVDTLVSQAITGYDRIDRHGVAMVHEYRMALREQEHGPFIRATPLHIRRSLTGLHRRYGRFSSGHALLRRMTRPKTAHHESHCRDRHGFRFFIPLQGASSEVIDAGAMAPGSTGISGFLATIVTNSASL